MTSDSLGLLPCPFCGCGDIMPGTFACNCCGVTADAPRADYPAERNRATSEPGGMECERCGCIFIGAESHTLCGVCVAAPPADPVAGMVSFLRGLAKLAWANRVIAPKSLTEVADMLESQAALLRATASERDACEQRYLSAVNGRREMRAGLSQARDELKRANEQRDAAEARADAAERSDRHTKGVLQAMERDYLARIDRLRACVKAIVETYDQYRRRGVAPAPAEYADVVAAIDAARREVGE